MTSNGLSRLNKNRNYYTYYEVSHSLNGQTIGNQVKAALVSRNGITWLATLHGVIRINPATGEKTIFTTQSSEPYKILLNNVYALEEDDYGCIWIGTAGGINVWDEASQQMHAITSNPTNGLNPQTISPSLHAAQMGLGGLSAWEGGLFKVTGNLRDISSLRFEELS